MSSHRPRPLLATTIAAILCLGLGFSSTALAAPMTYLSLEELAARSDACALARVVDARVHWNDARTLIVTTFTLEVEEALSGALPGGELLLHRLGGELDGMALGYEGMPELEVGDRGALFLLERAPGAYIVSGLQQGVLLERESLFFRDTRELLRAPGASESLELDELRARLSAVAPRQR